MVEVMKIMVTSFKRSHARTAALSAPDPAPGHRCTDPCLRWRLPDAHQQVWVCLLWGHCSFLLGPGAHKVLFVPSKRLFSQSCVSSGGCMVEFNGNSLLPPRGLMPYPGLLHPEPLPLQQSTADHTSTGDTQTQFCLSLCGFLSPGASVVCLSPLSISGGYGV